MKTRTLVFILVGLVGAAAPRCLAADATELFGKNCASCHGKDGAGHTKAGRLVGAKDLTDAQVQKAFTDAQAFDALKNGLKDKDGKVQMKPFAEKLSDDDIKALLAYVRTFAK